MAPFANRPVPSERLAEESRDGRLKCVLVGDGAVGKTSLIVSYTTNGYPTEYVPTAFDNYNVRVTVDNRPICFQLCDTAGQDDFDALRPLCYPGTDVFLLCFSVVNPTSFYNLRDKWLPEIRLHRPNTPLLLVGTQCDLRSDVKVLIELASYRERPVSEAQAQRLAHLIQAHGYVDSSALTQKNLKQVFDTAITLGLSKPRPYNYIPALLNTSPAPHNNNNEEEKVDEKYMKRRGWKKLCCF